MPYIILNDRHDPTHYYTGQGFMFDVETSVSPEGAHVFVTWPDATVPLLPNHRARYEAGWRIVPVAPSPIRPATEPQ